MHLLLLALLACKDEDGAALTDSAIETEDTPGDSALPGPCAAGDWGTIGAFMDPALAIHLSAATGSPTGTGSSDDPVDTIEAAQALSRTTTTALPIAVWPGTYTTSMHIYDNQADDFTDNG